MNILIIGKGFDLEHDLPTKYIDFLDFIAEFTKVSGYKASINRIDIRDSYIRDLCEGDIYKDRYNALSIFTKKSCWINYFQQVRKEHMINQENWIDFEKEISIIIQVFEGLISYYENQKREVNANEKFEEHCLTIMKKIFHNTNIKL